MEPFSGDYYGVWGPGEWMDASDDVVIFGGGMIGLAALLVCRAASAKLTLVEPLANRRESPKSLGADAVIDPTQVEDLAAVIGKHTTTARGATVAVEASGNDRAIAALFEVVEFQPRMRPIGHSIGRKIPVEIGKTMWRGIAMYGQGGTSHHLPRTIAFMDRIRKNVDLTRLISHTFPFEKIHDAIETAVTKKVEAHKVMLTF